MQRRAAFRDLDDAQEQAMVYKVNYGLERAERNRAKEAKKAAKAEAKKAARDGTGSAEAAPADATTDHATTDDATTADANRADASRADPISHAGDTPGDDQAS
jgi:hypothetical protein